MSYATYVEHHPIFRVYVEYIHHGAGADWPACVLGSVTTYHDDLNKISAATKSQQPNGDEAESLQHMVLFKSDGLILLKSRTARCVWKHSTPSWKKKTITGNLLIMYNFEMQMIRWRIQFLKYLKLLVRVFNNTFSLITTLISFIICLLFIKTIRNIIIIMIEQNNFE